MIYFPSSNVLLITFAFIAVGHVVEYISCGLKEIILNLTNPPVSPTAAIVHADHKFWSKEQQGLDAMSTPCPPSHQPVKRLPLGKHDVLRDSLRQTLLDHQADYGLRQY